MQVCRPRSTTARTAMRPPRLRLHIQKTRPSPAGAAAPAVQAPTTSSNRRPARIYVPLRRLELQDMPLRIFTACLSTETNTFVPIPTGTSAFTVYRPEVGVAAAAAASPHPCYDVLRRRAVTEGFVLLEGLGATAPPSGTVRRDTYEAFRDEILAQCAAAMPLDGAVLGLHGAMVAHGYDDVEGDLLSALRELMGPAAVIGVEFDPHMHLTQLRFDSADILVTYKEFPHVDIIERAEEVVGLTLRTIRGEINPAMAKWDCRMIEVLPTSTQPMRGFVDGLMAIESHSEGSMLSELSPEQLQRSGGGEEESVVLSCSCVHGFMAADVQQVGAAIVVITDGDDALAAALAERLGRELFELRGQTRPDYWAPDEGVEEAYRLGSAGRPAVIADVWDNPGGGPAGDGTVILQSLLRRRQGDGATTSVGFSGIWDPQAVSLCRAAGVGARLQLRFGGKTSHLAGDPIDALVVVEGVVDDCSFSSNNGDRRSSLGAAALIALPSNDGNDSILVILHQHRAQVVNPDVWENFEGLRWQQFGILVVKSTNHFYGGFAPIAATLIYVDTGLVGLSPYPNNPTLTQYTKLDRPVWPRDMDPHGSGAFVISWQQARQQQPAKEALARL